MARRALLTFPVCALMIDRFRHNRIGAVLHSRVIGTLIKHDIIHNLSSSHQKNLEKKSIISIVCWRCRKSFHYSPLCRRWPDSLILLTIINIGPFRFKSDAEPRIKKARAKSGFFNSGGDEEDRTPDLRIANATLSQLSYVPMYRALFYNKKRQQNIYVTQEAANEHPISASTPVGRMVYKRT